MVFWLAVDGYQTGISGFDSTYGTVIVELEIYNELSNKLFLNESNILEEISPLYWDGIDWVKNNMFNEDFNYTSNSNGKYSSCFLNSYSPNNIAYLKFNVPDNASYLRIYHNLNSARIAKQYIIYDENKNKIIDSHIPIATNVNEVTYIDLNIISQVKINSINYNIIDG